MNKVLIWILVWLPFAVFAQKTETPREMFQQRFSAFRHQEFQEKVYLHTDKSFYVAGEQVWFSIYRTDAATHIPSVYSRFVYVELYNEREELVERLKVLEQDGCFSGSLPLDRYLPSGRYCLRAYTYWMQNFDETFYFRKEIVVGNFRTYGMRPEIRFGKTDKGQDCVEIRIRDAEGEIFPKAFLDCRMYHRNKQVRKDIGRINQEGWVRYLLHRKDSVTNLRVQFLNKKPFEYQVNLSVPILEKVSDVDIQFFPEGGHWIAGKLSRVSFKAVGTDGYGVEVCGSIYGNNDRLVGGFVSSHLGMGCIELLPESGQKYYAMVQLPGGVEKRVDLPAVREEGVILRAEVRDSVICYACSSSPGYLEHRDLYLLVHSRGVLRFVLPVGPEWSGKLALKDLLPGIVQGVLVDGRGNVYSERLSFVYPPETKSLEISSDRLEYDARDSVRLTLDYPGMDSLRCSLAVTDCSLAPPGKWGMNISNYFLLTSDLKGHIEDPDWYFDSGVTFSTRMRMLDLLLSTQGWTRFDVGRVCRNERDSLPFFLELSQGFSGQIKNFWGKGAKSSVLYVIAPRVNFLKKVQADRDGHFKLDVFFPDSTVFVFQALSSRNSKWVELYMEEDSLRPPLKYLLLPERLSMGKMSDEMKNSSILGNPEKVKVRGYYYENGQRVYLLDEAKVMKKKAANTYLERYENIAESIWEARDIRDEGIKSMLGLLTAIPGGKIEIIGGGKRFYYKNLKTKVYLYVNELELLQWFGMEEALDMLEQADIRQVERMGYVVDSPPFRGGMQPGESNLVVFIYLRPGYSLYPASTRLDFAQFSPLGYHEPTAFYQPRYEVEEERNKPEPDERSTLYWNPNIRLGKGESKELKFYTSDREGPFEVVLEGITDQGKIVRTTLKIGGSERGVTKL